MAAPGLWSAATVAAHPSWNVPPFRTRESGDIDCQRRLPTGAAHKTWNHSRVVRMRRRRDHENLAAVEPTPCGLPQDLDVCAASAEQNQSTVVLRWHPPASPPQISRSRPSRPQLVRWNLYRNGFFV